MIPRMVCVPKIIAQHRSHYLTHKSLGQWQLEELLLYNFCGTGRVGGIGSTQADGGSSTVGA